MADNRNFAEAYKDLADSFTPADIVLVKHFHTLRFALKLAEKVCGEPSDAACKAGWEQHRNDFHSTGYYRADLHFKAMRDQMIAEVESEG